MRPGVAKIDQQAIPKILRDMALEAGNHLGAGLLIGPHYRAEVFRIKLTGEHGGLHEVTEQHGELAPFRLWRSGGGRRRCMQGRGGGRGDRRRSVAGPHQHAALLIHRQALAVDELVLEVVQGGIVQLKLPLEGAIGEAAPLAQEDNRLIHHGDKVHSVSSLAWCSASVRMRALIIA
jgi:hypothetical protein